MTYSVIFLCPFLLTSLVIFIPCFTSLDFKKNYVLMNHLNTYNLSNFQLYRGIIIVFMFHVMKLLFLIPFLCNHNVESYFQISCVLSQIKKFISMYHKKQKCSFISDLFRFLYNIISNCLTEQKKRSFLKVQFDYVFFDLIFIVPMGVLQWSKLLQTRNRNTDTVFGFSLASDQQRVRGLR